jgi:hypothetical protein
MERPALRAHAREYVDMPTALERSVDALSDPSVALPDALRSLLVVSRRINASELTAWLRAELDGYEVGNPVPIYREGSHMPLELRFDGPMGMSDTMGIQRSELPSSLQNGLENLHFRDPLAELLELSTAERDPAMQLPMGWVNSYRKLAARNEVPHISMMVLNNAAIKVPRTHLRGMLDRVKTTALDLALSLEDVSPDAGASGGPTVVDEPRLAQQVTVHLTQLFAEGATITVGDNSTVAAGAGAVAVRLDVGDSKAC